MSGKVSVGTFILTKVMLLMAVFARLPQFRGSAPEKISRSAPVKKARRNGPFLSTV